MVYLSSFFDSISATLTNENADWRRVAMGMKKGLGHGELIGSVDEAVERIEGTLKRTGLLLDGVVFGSRMIGLKNFISVCKESDDEQSLGVPDFFSLSGSDPAGLELTEADVDELEFESELLVIFDRNVIPRFRADLKMLYLLIPEASPDFAELAQESPLLQISLLHK